MSLSPRGIVKLTVERFLRQENNVWVGRNTDYKYHSTDMHFRWNVKWRLEHLGMLGIMVEMALCLTSTAKIQQREQTVSTFTDSFIALSLLFHSLMLAAHATNYGCDSPLNKFNKYAAETAKTVSSVICFHLH